MQGKNTADQGERTKKPQENIQTSGRTAPQSGLVVVDKPAGLTSADAVETLRRALGEKGTGHCGTLDPLATGVLVVCIGRARRVQELLMARPKSYCATIVLGATSVTDDAEGPITHSPDARPPAGAAITAALESLIGETQQQPPSFSAVKVEGVRAWKSARRGRLVEPAPRPVIVHAIELVDYSWPLVKIDVDCGRGTYIRSIARDLGMRLGVGGYLGELRRTRACGLTVDHAVPLAEVTRESIVPLEVALADEPRVDVAPEDAAALRAGARVPYTGDAQPGTAGQLFAWVGGEVLALVRIRDGAVQSRAYLACGHGDDPNAPK